MRRFLKNFIFLDPRSLKLFRQFLAILLAFDFILRGQHLELLYSQEGLFPIIGSNYFISLDIFNYFTWSHNQFIIFLQFAFAIVLCGFLFFGKYTKLVTFCLWYIYCSLNLRNGYVIHSAEDITRVVLFWSMFLPLSGESKMKKSSYAALGYLIQVFLIYIGVMFKRDYTAWVVVGNPMYISALSYPLVSDIGTWLLRFPDVLKFLSRFAYFYEFMVPAVAIIPKTRFFGALGMIAFHIGIGLFFNLSTFAYVGIIIWIPFLPSSFWRLTRAHWIRRLVLRGDDNFEHKLFTNSVFKTARRVVLTIAIIFVLVSALPNSFRMSMGIDAFLAQKPLRYFQDFTKMRQTWIMFSPIPSQMNGWHQVVLHKNDGDKIDLLTNMKPVDIKPDNVGDLYLSFAHWRYMWSISTDMRDSFQMQHDFLKYQCLQNDSSVKVEFYFLRDTVFELMTDSKNTKTLVSSMDCSKQALLHP